MREYCSALSDLAMARRTSGLLNGAAAMLSMTQFMSGWPITGPLSSM